MFVFYQMSVNNSYDEAPCQLRTSPPLRHEKGRGLSATVRANDRSQVCVAGLGGEGTETSKGALAEVKYHTLEINKRTGRSATEYMPCGLRDLLWQSNTPALRCCSVNNKAIKATGVA